MAAWFNKWLMVSLLPAYLYINGPHPLHLSVVEINHSQEDKTLEITCRIFRDDFEKILIQNNKTRVDLINPANKAAMEKLVNEYIYQHLRIKTGGKQINLTGIGFEFERSEDAIYSYFQAENISAIKNIEVMNTILYDLFDDQQNILHVTVGGNRKSSRLDQPAKDVNFSF